VEAEMTVSPRISRQDLGGVAVLTFDYPGRSMNVVDESVFAELRDHVQAVNDDDVVSSAVLISGKPASFGAGADVAWLPELVARSDAEGFLASVHELMAE